MRSILATVALLLGHARALDATRAECTPEQILQRSTHVFIGVIEKHEFPTRLLLRVSAKTVIAGER